jgi:hypothetical protein
MRGRVSLDHLPPHRKLIWFLETAQDCLDEAVAADARLGVLPHWARGQVREMAEELEDLLASLARAAPGILGPLTEAEVEDDDSEGA